MDCVKVKFSTEQYALFHITKHKKRNEDKGLVARAYKCNFCNGWHITSQVYNNQLVEDNEELRNQLVEQIKKSVDLKAEVEILKKQLKNKDKKVVNSEPLVQQLKQTVNKLRVRIRDLEDTRNMLIAKLNQAIK